MKEIIKINQPGYANRFFSDLLAKKEFKKIDWSKYIFKIFLGGKGRGKSWLCTQEMKKFIELGLPVAYMRNSLDEIKQAKSMLTQLVTTTKKYSGVKIRCSDEAITTWEGTPIITFISTKNYNKISGNMLPYAMLFYDEFNQVLTVNMSKMMSDFFNICQTLFRTEKWNVWACGNSKTANNVLYNILGIEPYLPTDLLNVAENHDFYIIVYYKPELFKHAVIESNALNLMRECNPSGFKAMINGDTFEITSDLVLNKPICCLDSFKPKHVILLYDTWAYEILTLNNYLVYVNNLHTSITESQIKEWSKYNAIYDVLGTWFNVSNKVKMLNESYLSKWLLTKLKNGLCFFNDYFLFTYMKEFGNWIYINKNEVSY